MRYLFFGFVLYLFTIGAAYAAEIYQSFPYRYKFAFVKGSQMAYIEEGQGMPVLFLHGTPTNSYLWRNVIPYVSPKARAIAVDLIGMGESEAPDIPYRFDDHADYLEAFIDQLELEEMIIVGQDWGGALAINYAAKYPDKVKGLVLMESILKPFNSLSEFRPKFAENIDLMRDPIKGQQKLIKENFYISHILPGQTLRQLDAQEFEAYAKYYTDDASRIPLWRWPNELPIMGRPVDMHQTILANTDYLVGSDMPKLMFYARPGGLGNANQVVWAQENLKNTTFLDIGPGIHLLPEENPHAIGAGIAIWLETTFKKQANSDLSPAQ